MCLKIRFVPRSREPRQLLMLYWEKLLFCSGIHAKPLQALCGQNVDYGLEWCFLTFVPWTNSENNFWYPGESLVVKTFPGQNKLIPGSAVQLLLNCGQENLCKKIVSISRDILGITQYFRISRFFYIPGFLAEPITIFCPNLVGKHRYRRLRKFRK